jgi:hypothetical protein
MVRIAALTVGCACLLLLFLCPAAWAKDVIELKSGEKVEGKIIDENRTEITVKTGETKIVLPKSMIKVMKLEVVDVYLSDGRELKEWQVEEETDHTVILVQRRPTMEARLTVDKMDIDEMKPKVVEKEAKVWPEPKKTAGSRPRPRRRKGRSTGLEKIVFPKPTENLPVTEIRRLKGEAMRLLQAKKINEAIKVYEKILRTDPKDNIALYNLACAYALKGDKNKAVKYLRMSVAAGYTGFSHMERDKDLSSIRGHKGYKELLKKRDAIQLQSAHTQLERLKQQYGEGYTYEIEEKRKLIFATNQSLEVLQRMKEHLFKFADAQWEMLWDNKPSYYITIICPDRATFRKMARPGVGGWYNPGSKILVCGDIGLTLNHEFTHSLHFADQEARRMSAPIYIIEGFATLFESSGFAGNKLKPRLISGRLNSLKPSVESGRHVPWEQFRVCRQAQYGGFHYAQGRYMMVYIYKKDKLKKWYDTYCKTYNQDKSAKAAWEKVFKKGFGEIEQDWIAWVKALEPLKRVRRGGPFLGVQSEECEKGIELFKVVDDSPADKAGLREGDILTHGGGKSLKTHNDFIDFLNAHKPGDKVKFKILRGKRKKTMTVTLGNRPGR